MNNYWKEYVEFGSIGNSTPKEKAIPAMNFEECILDIRRKFPIGKYNIFTAIEDLGVRMLSYGNSSGGKFSGPYRSFLIKYRDSTEIVSIGVSAYISYSNPDIEKTSINVAVDTEENSHHSLQLNVDENIEIDGPDVYFYHSGRIAIGNIGSGKIDELRKFVNSNYPKIISGRKFFLGKLKNNKLWYIDDPDMIILLENLISYALVRDEYRKFMKNNHL